MSVIPPPADPSPGAEPSSTSRRAGTRRRIAAQACAGLLVAHALAVLSGFADAPAWVPIVECLVASVIGLRLLRVEDERREALRSDGGTPWSTGAASSSRLPARVASAVEQRERPTADA